MFSDWIMWLCRFLLLLVCGGCILCRLKLCISVFFLFRLLYLMNLVLNSCEWVVFLLL